MILPLHEFNFLKFVVLLYDQAGQARQSLAKLLKKSGELEVMMKLVLCLNHSESAWEI